MTEPFTEEEAAVIDAIGVKKHQDYVDNDMLNDNFHPIKNNTSGTYRNKMQELLHYKYCIPGFASYNNGSALGTELQGLFVELTKKRAYPNVEVGRRLTSLP